jgi:hypothetical protein
MLLTEESPHGVLYLGGVIIQHFFLEVALSHSQSFVILDVVSILSFNFLDVGFEVIQIEEKTLSTLHCQFRGN